LMAVLIEVVLRSFAADYHPPFPFVGFLFLAITVGVAAFQYGMFRRYGGSYVAESMGGVRLKNGEGSAEERRFYHIAEEMAVASSLPMPALYVIDANEINAFAAGLDPEHAAIGITRGALSHLNRDELQGVVAHEFGHIRNGDMKISLRLAAMCMGFFFVLYIALRVLQITALSRRRGGNQAGGRAGGPLLLAALALIVAGAITWFAGSLLKAMVSRQREYLADASAVQFTRSPQGIAGALEKIGRQQKGDMPQAGMAYSHMYFDNHVGLNSLFATHPPLKKRIRAILGK
jgi:heat shock protein HtpX